MTTSGTDDYAAFRRALGRAAPAIRRPLPWIEHGDPWAILVSEVMLQQTQTTRVVEPWRRFVEHFPTPMSCANAPLADVLRHWSGLGYPRRAKALHNAAQVIRDQFDGTVPARRDQLRTLPGVGEYTANAVASFAFAQPVAILDTNVGRVIARAVMNRPQSAKEAREVAAALLPRRNGAQFNQAMLDLGAQFCRASPKCENCPVAGACRWHLEGGVDPAPQSAGVSRPQGPFEGSTRQQRGRILALVSATPVTFLGLAAALGVEDRGELNVIIDGLVRDGLVERRGRRIRLAGS